MEATHFIEVYSTPVGKSFNTSVNEIYYIEQILKQTPLLGLKTVAIFKIKLKSCKK